MPLENPQKSLRRLWAPEVMLWGSPSQADLDFRGWLAVTDSWVIITFLISRTKYSLRRRETWMKEGLHLEPGRVSLRTCVSKGRGSGEDDHRPAE